MEEPRQTNKTEKEQELYHYRGEVVSVYDGDTLTAKVDMGMYITNQARFRLYGLDAPEIRGETRLAGIASRDALRSLVLGKRVFIDSIYDRKEKYGRYIGVLWIEQGGFMLNVNAWMIQNGHAQPMVYV